jgi:hypothetical protein
MSADVDNAPWAPADVDQGRWNPSAMFANPEQVLAQAGLTRDEKIEILKLWEYDAVEAEVATEEGMPGGADSPLRRILLALSRLNPEIDVRRTGPTKQHALL